MRLRRSKLGFTIIELLIAMLISSILISITTSVYTLFRRSLIADQARADMVQNARVSIDRLIREVRQSPDVVTDMPLNAADNSVAQPSSIEFENGHDNDLTYTRYYLDTGKLKQQVKEYYFASSPSIRVHWNSLDASNNPPVANIISTTDMADNVSSLLFYGDGDLIQMIITTNDGGTQTYVLNSTVFRRNS